MSSPRITEKKLLAHNRYKLYEYTFSITDASGKTTSQKREAYDRGNGATILLYNRETRTVVLTRQFRLPSFVNGNADGMLIETCAGMLDEDHPEDAIRRETEEETGYRITDVQKVFEAYTSPGAVTELIHFFIGEYTPDHKVGEGGGLADEHENIEVLELPFEQAYNMIATGEIKDTKTILLLQYARIYLFRMES